VKGFVFDPSRLRGSAKQQEREGYRVIAGMLHEHLGGDQLAEFRRRAQRDPKLRAMFAAAADELQAAVGEIEATILERRSERVDDRA
jgi:hypothetical protein